MATRLINIEDFLKLREKYCTRRPRGMTAKWMRECCDKLLELGPTKALKFQTSLKERNIINGSLTTIHAKDSRYKKSERHYKNPYKNIHLTFGKEGASYLYIRLDPWEV